MSSRFVRVVAVIVAGCFVFQAACVPAFAEWRDRSGDLPGMKDDSEVLTDVAKTVGIIALIAGVVYFIVKGSKDKGKEPSRVKASALTDARHAKGVARVQPLLDFRSSASGAQEKQEAIVGVTVAF